MRILLLTHAFNSLTQRLFAELNARGHELSVEFDIADNVTEEAVTLFRPDVIVAPFLKRAIPASVWQKVSCFVVHPGIKGDRGPSALDWAIMNGEATWGVTVLQANAEMDGGDIWASAEFPMRDARKSSLYREEVTEAALRAVLLALERFASGSFRPERLDYSRPDVRGRLRPPMRQADRRIDWDRDDTLAVLRKIRAADGNPGVLDEVSGVPCYLYDAHAEATLRGHPPGTVIAQRNGAILRATCDGAVWITHLKPVAGAGERTFKLPAARLLGRRIDDVPESEACLADGASETWRDVWYEESDGVGYLHFDFYNGAMSTAQCGRLLSAFDQAVRRPTRVVVLMGGRDFWSNGIHLNVIEAAESPADESWRSIDAIDDVALAVLTCDSHLTVSALQGNAAAGGVFLALAADEVWARDGIVLNPHYKNMGNLYGSEYWTWSLPRRIGLEAGQQLMQRRFPLLAREAAELRLIDACFGAQGTFLDEVKARAECLARDPALPQRLAEKRRQRADDEAIKPLADYRSEELERMKLNFYGFDSSYHIARYNFVAKVPHSWTPRHLARHRSRSYAAPEGAVA